jgi:nitrite reductase/ring-hydroxylating ferredoxin subunit
MPDAQTEGGSDPDSTTGGPTRRLTLRCLTVLGVTGTGIAFSTARGVAAGPVSILVHTCDIRVGGGRVFRADKVVVTQPSKGRYKAFTAVCTHSGRVVGNITGDTINCLCHRSKFNIVDGSVVATPARAPLAPEQITVSGKKSCVADELSALN